MIPNGTIVILYQNDDYNYWSPPSVNFRKGKQHLYKITGTRHTWPGEPQKYECVLVDTNGKRRGTWDYCIRETCIRPFILKKFSREDWM